MQIRPTPLVLAACALTVLTTTSNSAPLQPPVKGAFLEQVKAHFAEWDTDHDASLSNNEMDLALANPAVKGPAAAAAVAVWSSIRSTKERTPLTLDVIAQNAAKSATAYTAALQRITTTPRALFTQGTPHLDKLKQGRLGDCFLLSSLGTYVNHAPKGLVGMMKSLPTGQVEVSFGTGQKVVMPPPTDGEIAIGVTTGGDGTWANMFEKAMGQVLLEKNPARAVSPYGIITKGGAPLTVLQYITGHKVVRVYCQQFRNPDMPATEREAKLADVRSALVKTQDANRMIVSGNETLGNRKRVPGITYNHSYTVLGYDPKTDAVTFRNPHCNTFAPQGAAGIEFGYPTKDGQFTVPLTEAVRWLGAFSIETDEPYDPQAKAVAPDQDNN